MQTRWAGEVFMSRLVANFNIFFHSCVQRVSWEEGEGWGAGKGGVM